MARRRRADRRETQPDLKYNSEVVARFITQMMRKGKRSVAERIIYDALAEVENKLDGDPVEIFETAIDNVRPQLEVKSRRVGGATYQVPLEVSSDRGRSIGMRWNARGRC